MTVRANKPEFNIREKLKSLDYSHVPYEKMPAGSVIQVKTAQTSGLKTANGLTNYPPNASSGVQIMSMTFAPKFANSKLKIMTSTMNMHEESNYNNFYWLGAYDNNTGDNYGIIAYAPQYTVFLSALNASIFALNSIADSWGTDERTILLRGGGSSNNASNVVYINGQSYSVAATDYSKIDMTIMEIKQ